LPIVPRPSNQESVKVLGISRAHMSGETLDFAPPNVVKPECRFPMAPTP
jgi:hypothetical protein